MCLCFLEQETFRLAPRWYLVKNTRESLAYSKVEEEPSNPPHNLPLLRKPPLRAPRNLLLRYGGDA